MRLILLPSLLLVIPCFGFGQGLSPERAQVLQNVANELKTRAYVPGIDLTRWDAIVMESKDRLATAQSDDDFAREVNVDLRKFGASHFRFMTPRQEQTRVTLRTVGLGISGVLGKDGMKIVAVAPGSPADKAKLQPGELLIKIDGKPATREALQGEEGKTVHVQLQGRKDITLTYAPYSLRRSATLTRVDANTALFRLPTFSNGYDRMEVERCINAATKYPNLIIDLRNNGGGAVISMQHLMSLFMPAGSTVGTFVTKPLVAAYGKSHELKKPDPVAIATWSRWRLVLEESSNPSFGP